MDNDAVHHKTRDKISSRRESAQSSAPFSFQERFSLAEFDDGDVVLDVKSGAFYRLNPAASRICRLFARGRSVPEVENDLVGSFRLSAEEARRDVAALTARLRQPRPADDRSPISFEAAADGSLLRWRGRPILRIDAQGSKLRLETPAVGDETEAAAYLDWVAPHLLALRGQPVLHASAVQVGGGVAAFSGSSGSGKTTTAQAFASAGARLISEDVVLISARPDSPDVYVNGETNLRRWIVRKAPLWVADPRVAIDAGDLLDVPAGPTLPLRQVLFVDSARRGGDRISVKPIRSGEALVGLLENTFAELGGPRYWKELFEMNRSMAARLDLGEATVPDGLGLLRDAARRYYSSISTS